MPSKRDRAKQERMASRDGESGHDKSCQALHPVYGTKCWMNKPCQPGERHMIVRPKANGVLDKLYWRVNE